LVAGGVDPDRTRLRVHRYLREGVVVTHVLPLALLPLHELPELLGLVPLVQLGKRISGLVLDLHALARLVVETPVQLDDLTLRTRLLLLLRSELRNLGLEVGLALCLLLDVLLLVGQLELKALLLRQPATPVALGAIEDGQVRVEVVGIGNDLLRVQGLLNLGHWHEALLEDSVSWVESRQAKQHPFLVGHVLPVDARVLVLRSLLGYDHVIELALVGGLGTVAMDHQRTVGPVVALSIARAPDLFLLDLQCQRRASLPCRGSRA